MKVGSYLYTNSCSVLGKNLYISWYHDRVLLLDVLLKAGSAMLDPILEQRIGPDARDL